MVVKVYNGYGHMHDLIVFGHVLAESIPYSKKLTNNFLMNAVKMMRLFFVKPLKDIKVQLQWRGQVFESITEDDGFFKFEWASETPTPAGWHTLVVHAMDEHNNIITSSDGKVFVPHVTQYAFVSDIDDTVLISHSATVFKRLRVLLSKNPRTRKTFDNVVKHYTMLASANTTPGVPNPFFYVSSSEWNLYEYLTDFFSHNKFPQGTFLLSQIKRLHNLVKTGKTKHEAKYLRIARILASFPNQQFVLLGDNSQSDPYIYNDIVSRHAGNIFAVYIRNVNEPKELKTSEILKGIEAAGVHTCFYKYSEEAIAHSQQLGLINA